MAKMRVHELAKELDIKSQDIIDTLSTTEYAVKSAQSGLEDDAQSVIRKKYAKTEAAPKKEEPKKEVKKETASEDVDYSSMKVAELKEIAAEKNIDVTGMKKADIVEALTK